MSAARPVDGTLDIGAYELPEPGIDTGLAAGLVALGLLSRRRRRSANRAC